MTAIAQYGDLSVDLKRLWRRAEQWWQYQDFFIVAGGLVSMVMAVGLAVSFFTFLFTLMEFLFDGFKLQVLWSGLGTTGIRLGLTLLGYVPLILCLFLDGYFENRYYKRLDARKERAQHFCDRCGYERPDGQDSCPECNWPYGHLI